LNIHNFMSFSGLAVLVIASATNVRASDREKLGRSSYEASAAIPNIEGLESYQLTNLKRIYFACGKSDASQELKTSLRNLVNIVGEGSIIELRGFADSAGSLEKNIALSTARAEGIAKFLIDIGIPSRRIRVIGLGAVDADGPALNPEHQRVDLRVFVAVTELAEPPTHNR
jgi:outer membrane protein OmpA-like peptidoglycan-associated protein